MPEEIGLFADTGNNTGHTHEPADAPQLVFGSTEEFLHEQLLPTYVRDVDDSSAKWCMEWYFHPEADSRVEALWRAWERMRLDGATGISVWWRDHADHHMRSSSIPRPLLQLRQLRPPRAHLSGTKARTGRMVSRCAPPRVTAPLRCPGLPGAARANSQP